MRQVASVYNSIFLIRLYTEKIAVVAFESVVCSANNTVGADNRLAQDSVPTRSRWL